MGLRFRQPQISKQLLLVWLEQRFAYQELALN